VEVPSGRVDDPPRRVSAATLAIFLRMTVRILLFASYADLAGTGAVDLRLQAPTTVRELLAQLRRALPAAGALPERPLVAVNRVHARLDSPVQDGDEVALLPPMAGG
jgi:molybdopterin converting factor subunit 1